MRLTRLIAPIAAALLTGSIASVAAAEEGRMPLSYTERPLTLPKLTLAPELGIIVDRGGSIQGLIAAASSRRGLEVEFGIEIGARFGILDDLEVGATVVPLFFTPTVFYGNPVISGTYRFLKGDFELGARLSVEIFHNGFAGAWIKPGAQGRLHIGKRMKLDVGAYIPIIAAQGAGVGLEIPAEFAFDIIEPLHVGATTGVAIYNFKTAGETFAVPLGFIAGYAIGSAKGPFIDIDPFFRWPFFALPGSRGDKINAGLFETGLSATLYLYL